MITYSKEEMVGITELNKSIGKYISKVSSNPKNKIAIIRRNKPEAIIIPIEEYENLRADRECLEELANIQIIKERMIDNGEPQMLTFDDMEKYFKDRGIL